jgi:hypothetical protein
MSVRPYQPTAGVIAAPQGGLLVLVETFNVKGRVRVFVFNCRLDFATPRRARQSRPARDVRQFWAYRFPAAPK